MYVPDAVLNQVEVLRGRYEIRRALHWGIPLHNRACTGYCTCMLAMEKITSTSKSDHVPRCCKSI